MLSLKIFVVAYALWNGYVFMAMGRDKRRAKRHQWRTPETSLLLMGAALGGIGLYAGMKYFRHKTSHTKFVIGAPILLVLNVLVIGFAYYAGHFRLNLF
ncbi:DUF1294 domain-containing protein [Desulfosporosinus fructosivorans]|uniref:DUF1294 domain-containing protein n=1 Tax=Desulfosporosinus fructosivorans TaxID=2018669 RepID=A0A4Z0R5S1_9FIRM|nr:DUF1294 domain-containing protein [Desulfosporosinus fructosivorans]TGE37493.1 DUF1294 domain-containing protein [Desulfosporosinus fructosivorans]